MENMALVYLSLGSNLGNRKEKLLEALSLIENGCGTIVDKSGIYRSAPWGYKSDNEFLNMVISVSTTLKATDLLRELQSIEVLLGRSKTKEAYSDRPIDIDIVFYDQIVIQSPDLTIPHPLMEQRSFVLEPLMEIAPDFRHPRLNKTIRELLASLSGSGI